MFYFSRDVIDFNYLKGATHLCRQQLQRHELERDAAASAQLARARAQTPRQAGLEHNAQADHSGVHREPLQEDRRELAPAQLEDAPRKDESLPAPIRRGNDPHHTGHDQFVTDCAYPGGDARAQSEEAQANNRHEESKAVVSGESAEKLGAHD